MTAAVLLYITANESLSLCLIVLYSLVVNGPGGNVGMPFIQRTFTVISDYRANGLLSNYIRYRNQFDIKIGALVKLIQNWKIGSILMPEPFHK